MDFVERTLFDVLTGLFRFTRDELFVVIVCSEDGFGFLLHANTDLGCSI